MAEFASSSSEEATSKSKFEDSPMPMRMRPEFPQPSESYELYSPMLMEMRPDFPQHSESYLSTPETKRGYGHVGCVSKAQQTSGSVTDLTRQLADLKQELKATTERVKRIEITLQMKATPTPTHRDPGADSDLCDASKAGNLASVKQILAAGRADVNCRGRVGMTPLMWAARCGRRDVVELLISEGADVSLVNEYGNSTLHCACLLEDLEMIKFVLSHTMADINIRGEESRTPMMWAALKGHRKVVDFLVSEGALVSPVDDGGNNILHCACQGGDVETVEFVLSLNVVDINVKNKKGQTAADVAKLWGRPEVVELLLSHQQVEEVLEPLPCHVM
ncbi:ankyrin repeat domain-containing protein 29-like isoform X2 [Haliotis rufescens]|uniref:ankyrin repeat domain-containing protein 29-like isoform X2 n=1 Tax=Haliotis rufescens TaxID=6454 RepID=UPI00201F9FE6|nr:ankyrin repeat domain-containing protein 29-like isoform X2 [Haliotis rufescens]